MYNDELHDRLVSGREADLITGTSRSRRYELMKEGKYPQPVKIGKLTKFSYRELQAYVRDVLSQREGGA
jgi:predicted DNA-binding transcriptional regulator AlpA